MKNVFILKEFFLFCLIIVRITLRFAVYDTNIYSSAMKCKSVVIAIIVTAVVIITVVIAAVIVGVVTSVIAAVT